jgi:hypothetical protein
MPPMAEKNFPKEGRLLYRNDDEPGRLPDSAGFKNVEFVIKGSTRAPERRLAPANM